MLGLQMVVSKPSPELDGNAGGWETVGWRQTADWLGSFAYWMAEQMRPAAKQGSADVPELLRLLKDAEQSSPGTQSAPLQPFGL